MMRVGRSLIAILTFDSPGALRAHRSARPASQDPGATPQAGLVVWHALYIRKPSGGHRPVNVSDKVVRGPLSDEAVRLDAFTDDRAMKSRKKMIYTMNHQT